MPTMPTEAKVIYDSTSGANAVLDTGAIDTKDFDSLLITVQASGNNTAGGISFETYDSENTARVVYNATFATAQSRFSGCWGPGCTGSYNHATGGSNAFPAPLPATIRLQVAALGTGVTGRLIVIGRKNYRLLG